MELVLLKRREGTLSSLSLPCENTSWPSASQRDSSHQEPNLPAPWSQISSLQNWKKINSYCLSSPGCSILLEQPEHTSIYIYVYISHKILSTVIYQYIYHINTHICFVCLLNMCTLIKTVSYGSKAMPVSFIFE